MPKKNLSIIIIVFFLAFFAVAFFWLTRKNDSKKHLPSPQESDFYLKYIPGDPGGPISCREEKCILNELSRAMREKNIPRTWMITQKYLLPFYGDKAGIPDDYKEIKYASNNFTMLSQEQLDEEYKIYWNNVKILFNPDGTFKNGQRHLWRDYVSYGINLLYYAKADVKNRKEVIEFLQKMGDNMISTQSKTGVFGAPDLRNSSIQDGDKEKTLTMIKNSQLALTSQDFENGWQINQKGGGLQFDNGFALAFLSLLYQETSSQSTDWNYAPKRDSYLTSAKLSAEWIKNQDCVFNFNYNSFSSYGLAYLYQATQDSTYLDLAIQKMKLGVFPGTIPDGRFNDWRDGRFMDSHNAKNSYHWIVVRAAITTLSVMPKNRPDYNFMKYYTDLVFNAGVREILEFGVWKTSPADELAEYCLNFSCDEKTNQALLSNVYWNNKKINSQEGRPVGIYYYYRKTQPVY